MTEVVFDGLQEFIDAAMEVDEWRLIEGAAWNEEIGALTEAVAELIDDPPMLIFDRIVGYPPGYRVVSLPMASARRAALALGLRSRARPKSSCARWRRRSSVTFSQSRRSRSPPARSCRTS